MLTSTSNICDVLTSGLNAADIDYDILIHADQGSSCLLMTSTLKSDSRRPLLEGGDLPFLDEGVRSHKYGFLASGLAGGVLL